MLLELELLLARKKTNGKSSVHIVVIQAHMWCLLAVCSPKLCSILEATVGGGCIRRSYDFHSSHGDDPRQSSKDQSAT